MHALYILYIGGVRLTSSPPWEWSNLTKRIFLICKYNFIQLGQNLFLRFESHGIGCTPPIGNMIKYFYGTNSCLNRVQYLASVHSFHTTRKGLAGGHWPLKSKLGLWYSARFRVYMIYVYIYMEICYWETYQVSQELHSKHPKLSHLFLGPKQQRHAFLSDRTRRLVQQISLPL